ncbi:helix-turn-helix domain-containing protein [Paraburkholderia lycopersici]|uniref:helix-turn-helix domain-containing protein n=1 Tax=Paraburkholderia lycopersici TaxID=416944 RepID=UPI003CCC1496
MDEVTVVMKPGVRPTATQIADALGIGIASLRRLLAELAATGVVQQVKGKRNCEYWMPTQEEENCLRAACEAEHTAPRNDSGL